LIPLHTLDANISIDYPMLASGWLPPLPGSLFSLLGCCIEFLLWFIPYPIVSFLSGFTLTLYAGFGLERPAPCRQATHDVIRRTEKREKILKSRFPILWDGVFAFYL
jgi:hypothetical protein